MQISSISVIKTTEKSFYVANEFTLYLQTDSFRMSYKGVSTARGIGHVPTF
jgi:hypothetical protein